MLLMYSLFLSHLSTPHIYTLSLHDALPISTRQGGAAPHGGILQTRSRPHAPRRRQMCTWPPRPGHSPTKRKARRGAGKQVVAAKKLLRCTGDSLSTLTLSACCF